MKKFNAFFLAMIVVMIALVGSQAFADTNTYEASPTENSVNRRYDVSNAIVSAGENAVFDRLLKKELVSIGTTKICCPLDITSTNTADIGYMTSVVPPCKVVITPYAPATASVTYDIYATTASGVTTPDTTCLLPLTNGRYEKTFFGMPNVVFGGNQTGTMTVEVWVPSY
ncbi:MAG: hypothetical protein PHV05_03000 [Candidatus Riflebacteria bacterium]|nr:hypothetical protein [Candidatus Riflebacteria bacterium]